MPTASIVYRSATGTTRRFAEEIGAHLRTRGVDAVVQSVGEADPASLASADFVLLGCWTSGLFATYKLRTGSMFPRMRAALANKAREAAFELKSKDGHLSDAGRQALDGFIAKS